MLLQLNFAPKMAVRRVFCFEPQTTPIRRSVCVGKTDHLLVDGVSTLWRGGNDGRHC
jgi:hypothetical protein